MDAFPLDPNEHSDYDGDGKGDNEDWDDDGDESSSEDAIPASSIEIGAVLGNGAFGEVCRGVMSYTLPGGKQDPGEDSIEAALREADEERELSRLSFAIADLEAQIDAEDDEIAILQRDNEDTDAALLELTQRCQSGFD